MKSGYSGNKFSGFSGPGNCFDVIYNSIAEANAEIHPNYRHSSRRVFILNKEGNKEIYTWTYGWRDENLVKVDFRMEFTQFIEKFKKDREYNDPDLILAEYLVSCFNAHVESSFK